MNPWLFGPIFAALFCGYVAVQSFWHGERNLQVALQTKLVVTDRQNDVGPVSYGQVLTRSIVVKPNVQPARIEEIYTQADCYAPKASQGAMVAYVYTYGGGKRTPLQHVNGKDGHRIAAVRDARAAVQPDSFSSAAMATTVSSMTMSGMINWASRVDVLVTETSEPVFLHLNSNDSVFWNIQRAPGVRIDGVVINAYSGGVIANGVAPDRTGFVTFKSSPSAKCYIGGHGRPIPVEVRIAGARRINPGIELGSYVERWEEDYYKSLSFFGTTLPMLAGKNPDWMLYDTRGGSFEAVLVGPVPPHPFEPQPITRLQVEDHAKVFWGTRDDALKHFSARN